MTQPQTPQEGCCQLPGILEWSNFTMAAMTMVHNFYQPTQQLMGQPQIGLMGPLYQQAYQPRSLMGSPPVMSCSPMATLPMARSPYSTT